MYKPRIRHKETSLQVTAPRPLHLVQVDYAVGTEPFARIVVQRTPRQVKAVTIYNHCTQKNEVRYTGRIRLFNMIYDVLSMKLSPDGLALEEEALAERLNRPVRIETMWRIIDPQTYTYKSVVFDKAEIAHA